MFRLFCAECCRSDLCHHKMFGQPCRDSYNFIARLLGFVAGSWWLAWGLRGVGRPLALVAPRDLPAPLWSGQALGGGGHFAPHVSVWSLSRLMFLFVFQTFYLIQVWGLAIIYQVHFLWRGMDSVGVGVVAMMSGVGAWCRQISVTDCSVLRLQTPQVVFTHFVHCQSPSSRNSPTWQSV